LFFTAAVLLLSFKVSYSKTFAELRAEEAQYIAEHPEIIKAKAEEYQINTIKEEENKKNAPTKIKELTAYKSEDISRMDDTDFYKYSTDLKETCSYAIDDVSKKSCDWSLFSLDLEQKLRKSKEDLKNIKSKKAENIAASEKKDKEEKKKPSVTDIELFTINPRVVNDEVEVSFTYKNKTTGYVLWENDSLECRCEFKSGIVDDSKTTILNNHNQNMYLKIDWSEMKRQTYKFEAGKVICSIYINGNKLEAIDTVYLRY
jgi:hypothetical protein